MITQGEDVEIHALHNQGWSISAIDVYVDSSGAVRCAVPRLRIETRAGEVSKGMTVRHPAIESLSAAIAAALPQAWGAITIQMIEAADGPRVIEINPRFGGGYPLSW